MTPFVFVSYEKQKVNFKLSLFNHTNIKLLLNLILTAAQIEQWSVETSHDPILQSSRIVYKEMLQKSILGEVALNSSKVSGYNNLDFTSLREKKSQEG